MIRNHLSTRRAVQVGATLLCLALAATPAAFASSHREAPGILSMPQVDGTDFYLFRSYEEGRGGYLTAIANYLPLQDPFGGPNYFPLDSNAVYDIHLNNDADIAEDITFRFRVSQTTASPLLDIGGETGIWPPLGNIAPFGVPGGLGTVFRFFTLEVIRNGRPTGDFAVNRETGGNLFAWPYDNIGRKTIRRYEDYANIFIKDIGIPGCGLDGRVFVGQRQESFYLPLGEVFDLVNLNPVGDPDGLENDLEHKNITSFALEVPISCVTDGDPIVGGWTTASLPRNRTLNTENQLKAHAIPNLESPHSHAGNLVQVSRLGHALVNELVIGINDKNLFNASHPANDAQFLTYVTNPTLPALLEALFAVPAPTNFPRQDLVAVFLTGVPGLTEDGTVGEVLRLNTSIAPTSRAAQHHLGVLGGDNAGYPNGRRPGDDVVDISLRASMGVLCHAFPGTFCDPDDAPVGDLPFTDQVLQEATQFGNAFPYLNTPIPGSPHNN